MNLVHLFTEQQYEIEHWSRYYWFRKICVYQKT